LLKIPPELVRMISSRDFCASGFALEEPLEVLHVALVVLLVVVLERFLGHRRSESVLGVG
jgi:hypothetical protein